MWQNFRAESLYWSPWLTFFRFDYTNKSNQEIVAIEVITLMYDVFERPLAKSRLVIPGGGSENIEDLAPGESESEGFIRRNIYQNLFTAICYVNLVRLSDGSLWLAPEDEILEVIRESFRVPELEMPEVPAESDTLASPSYNFMI